MMRVTVEIWPGGNPCEAREMVTMDIGNVSGLVAVSDYTFEAVLNCGQPDQRKVTGRIDEHERALGWPALVKRAMFELEKDVQANTWRKLAEELRNAAPLRSGAKP